MAEPAAAGIALRVIVTRPAAQAAAWVAALQALGVDAAALPLIGIAPPADAAPVRAAWQTLQRNALVVFVSPNAVQQFFALQPSGVPWPDDTLAGATGPGTSSALREAGVPAPLVVEPAEDAAAFDSEALWALLAPLDWAGRCVLVVRGEDGRDWLGDTLASRGARVGFVAAYRRQPPLLNDAGQALLAAALDAPRRHLWLFSSSEAIGQLQRLAAGMPAGQLQRLAAGMPADGARPPTGAAVWSASIAVASHPRIVQTARAAGFGSVTLTAPAAEAVARWLHSATG